MLAYKSAFTAFGSISATSIGWPPLSVITREGHQIQAFRCFRFEGFPRRQNHSKSASGDPQSLKKRAQRHPRSPLNDPKEVPGATLDPSYEYLGSLGAHQELAERPPDRPKSTQMQFVDALGAILTGF